MTYEEFKENFLPEFLNINSYAGRIRFANQNLERLGSGSGRIVYNIDGEKALKLAKNAKGVAQNEAEANTGYYRDTQHIVTEVFDNGDNYTWLISELAKKVSKKRIEELTGIPSLNDLFYFLSNIKEQNNGRKKIFGQEKEMEEFFWENEFVTDLVDFIANYNQSVGDMGRPSTYGEVLRDGQPTIVLTDYGLNDEVYDTHYSPKRKPKYQMYELFNYADGNDDILSDAGGGQDIRRGMWAQMPYSVSDGQGLINEKFVKFVKNRNKYPSKPVESLPILADGFNECVNNIKGILEIVENKEQFYNNLLELQNYLIEQNYYNREPLLKEEYVINEEIPDVEQYSLEDKNDADELAKEVAIKLNLNQPRYLGGGANGFAYEINDNLVLKLTSDVSEADAASKLLRGKPEHIAKIYNLYKVHDTETDKAYFAILQENINYKPIEKFKKMQNDITEISPDGMGYVDIMYSIKKPKRFDYEAMLNFAKKILTENPEANVSKQERQEAYEFLVEMIEIRKELLDFDIKSVDYIENANLGYKNNLLKFFDTGGYRGVGEPDFSDNDIITLPEDATSKFTSDTAINQDEFPSYNTYDTTPSINNNLDANITMYKEDLEYKHVKGDASEDEYMIGESDINLSKEDYQRIDDDEVLQFIKEISKFINQIKSNVYLSTDDLNDLKFLLLSMNYNRSKYREHMGNIKFNDVFNYLYTYLKKKNVLREERNKSFGSGSKTVEVKKKCRLGGKGNTSVACNQGDINNLILKSIKEEIQNNLELKEYFSSLVPKIDESKIMTIQELPFKEEIQELGGKIYSVGGAVRDEFLGKESKDLDILISGIPMDDLEQIISKYGTVNNVGKSFGVLKFVPEGSDEEIDIAIPRTETPTGTGGHQGFDVKSDHELPIEKDLERRDFSINAIAKDIDGNIIDPYNGQEDLKNKIIRIVNPEAFSDDALRMLRAVQFASRFGFTIEPKTMQMIIDNADKITEIAPERILIELDKILRKGNIPYGIELLSKTGLFKQIFGNEITSSQISQRNFNNAKTMAELLFLMMYDVVQNPADFYLQRFATEDAKRDKVYKELQALDLAFNSDLVDQQMNAVKARSVAHNMFKIAPQTLESKIIPEIIANAGQELLQGKYPKTVNELAVNGNDIMQRGLQGKAVGDMQKSMLIWIYADKVRNDREELLSLVNKTNEMEEGYGNYSKPPDTWNINGELVTIDFFVDEYDKWNNRNGEDSGYEHASKASVLEFLQNNYEDESTDENLIKQLYWALTDRDVLKENNEVKKVSYSGVVLDDKSRTMLIKVFSKMIPEGWDIITHHMTIKMGALEDGSQEKQDMEDGKEIHLNVTDYAMDDKVMAVGVKGYPSTNEKPHITIAVNRAEGGKPYMSNKLTDWRKIGFSFDLTGKIQEI